MSVNKNRKLTSVKVDKELFNDFKAKSMEDKQTFQRLVEVCLHSYVNDIRFRKFISDYNKF